MEGAYAALQGTAIDIVSVELTDGHGSVFVTVHLDECEATVRLKTGLENVAEVLEKRDEVVLRGVRGQVAHVARGLPLRGLLDDHVVALDAMGGEMVMAEGRGRSHAHSRHSLLLGDGRLSLLIGPVAADRTRSKPLTIHRAQSLIGVGAIAESDKAVASRATGLHVPHDPSLGNGAKRREGLQKNVVVDLVAQITNKDVEVVRRILLGHGGGLVGPVDTDFL